MDIMLRTLQSKRFIMIRTLQSKRFVMILRTLQSKRLAQSQDWRNARHLSQRYVSYLPFYTFYNISDSLIFFNWSFDGNFKRHFAMGEKGLKMKFKMSWLQLKSLFHCQHARKRSIVFSRISLHGCFQHKKSKVRSLYHFCFDSVVTLMPRYSPNQRHQTVLNKKKPLIPLQNII